MGNETVMTIIPRRSVLYLPAANSRAIEKCRTIAADTVILDLEDSVSPNKKQEARDNLLAELHQGGFVNKEVVVRVNTLESPWGEADVVAMASTSADAICLPKVESVAQIEALCGLLDANGGAKKSLWIMAETPAALIDIETLVRANDRIKVLLMGTSDLAKELRVPVTSKREGLQYALQRCVVAARLAGIDIIDGVHVDLQDEQGFADACEQGRLLGFDGKSLIHPKQLAAANTCFMPSDSEAVHAEKVMAAWEQGVKESAGVIVVDGKLIEQLHVDTAERTLQLYRQIKARNTI